MFSLGLVALTYTADDILKIIGALGVFLGIAGGIAVNIIVALRTGKKVDENTKITEKGIAEVSAKADVISGHVNSQASAADAKITALTNHVEMLKAMLDTAEITARSAQQNAARALDTAAAAVASPVPNGFPVVERRVRSTDKDKDLKS